VGKQDLSLVSNSLISYFQFLTIWFLDLPFWSNEYFELVSDWREYGFDGGSLNEEALFNGFIFGSRFFVEFIAGTWFHEFSFCLNVNYDKMCLTTKNLNLLSSSIAVPKTFLDSNTSKVI